MPPLGAPSKVDSSLQKEKLANSYRLLLDEFHSEDLQNVGNYKLGALIGKGSFGKVYLARHKLTNGSKVVLKSSGREDANLPREVHHHRQFIHPHIARLYEVIVTETLVWLVLEYCPGDELYNYLLRNGPIPIAKVQRIFAQLVGAVSYIHAKSCVHRDLKLENILLDKNEDVKLCDFGFTREYEGKTNQLQTFCGTICYSAPEMIKGEKYAGEKVDVWSLGVILYTLIAGQLPFDEDDEQATKQKILTEDPKFDDRFPEKSRQLIGMLLAKRPLLRPTLRDILNHPFLVEHRQQQQAILDQARPPPFSTPLEKVTLGRLSSAGVNTEQVVESVLSQRCDALAGWWAILSEKEQRKEKRRERKRKEKEAENRNRRLSGGSSRLEKRMSAPLADVEEEDGPDTALTRTNSRGRGTNRPRRVVTPQFVTITATSSPSGQTQLTTALDNLRSPNARSQPDDIHTPRQSSSPPPPQRPEKETPPSRRSMLHMSKSHPDLQSANSGVKRPGRRKHGNFMHQLASLKHWFVESTKRGKSPNNKHSLNPNHHGIRFLSDKNNAGKSKTQDDKNNGNQLASPHLIRSKNASATSLAPSHASYPPATRLSTHAVQQQDSWEHQHGRGPHHSPSTKPSYHMRRNSMSPSPLAPRNAYRIPSSSLRGRKSTSSSISSIRSIHHGYSLSKASSVSSNSNETSSTPTGSTAARLGSRSPLSFKGLPAPPDPSMRLPNGIRLALGNPPTSSGSSSYGPGNAFNERAPIPLASSHPASGRRRPPFFKGTALSGNVTESPIADVSDEEADDSETPPVSGRRLPPDDGYDTLFETEEDDEEQEEEEENRKATTVP